MGRRGGGEGGEGMKGDSDEILFQSFVRQAIMCSSGMDKDAHPWMLSFQHLLLPTTASSALQGALRDGFGDVVGHDMPEACEIRENLLQIFL